MPIVGCFLQGKARSRITTKASRVDTRWSTCLSPAFTTLRGGRVRFVVKMNGICPADGRVTCRMADDFGNTYQKSNKINNHTKLDLS